MEEKVYFSNDDVQVTHTRCIVSGQTYTMAGVTSIRHAIEEPSRGWPVLLLTLGVVLLFAGMSSKDGVGVIVFGFIVAIVAFWWLISQKSKHVVVLHSSSGESRALVSTDPDYIGKVVAALNAVVVARG